MIRSYCAGREPPSAHAQNNHRSAIPDKKNNTTMPPPDKNHFTKAFWSAAPLPMGPDEEYFQSLATRLRLRNTEGTMANKDDESSKKMNIRDPSWFKKLPLEIREKIFKESVVVGLHTATELTTYAGYQHPVESMPPLISALQSDPALHQEALAVFYKYNVHTISKMNLVWAFRVSKGRLGMIKHLCIKVE